MEAVVYVNMLTILPGIVVKMQHGPVQVKIGAEDKGYMVVCQIEFPLVES